MVQDLQPGVQETLRIYKRRDWALVTFLHGSVLTRAVDVRPDDGTAESRSTESQGLGHLAGGSKLGRELTCPQPDTCIKFPRQPGTQAMYETTMDRMQTIRISDMHSKTCTGPIPEDTS